MSMAQLGGIVGGVGQALAITTPLTRAGSIYVRTDGHLYAFASESEREKHA